MEARSGLLEIRLKNYKSAAGAVLPLRPLTILVGPNGAGKSNILDALRLLSDAMRLQLRGALEAHGGLEAVRRRVPGARRHPRFGVAVQIQLKRPSQIVQFDYGFEVKAVANHGYAVSRERLVSRKLHPNSELFWFDRTEAGVRSNYVTPKGISSLLEHVDPSYLALPIFSGILPLLPIARDALTSMRTYSISPRVIGDLHAPEPGRELASDGRNIASVIQDLQRTRPEDHQRLCELLEAVVPGTREVTAVRYGAKLGLHFKQRVGADGKTLILDASSMSDGTLRTLGILAAVFQTSRPLLIAVEEPESTIHPGALGTLMDILRVGENRSQVLITTHSPDVLDAPDLDPAAIQLVRWQDGVTRVSPIGPASVGVLQEKLATVGELLRSNYLRPADDNEPEDVDLFPAIPGVAE